MGTTATGLDGVVVADTALSDVDGEAGRLIVVGDPIEAIAGTLSFTELATRLLTIAGGAPIDERALGDARAHAFARMMTPGALGDALATVDGMAALRAALAHSPAADPPTANARAVAPGAGRATLGDDHELDAIATVAVATAAHARICAGLAPLAPDAGAPHAHDVLRMLTGSADDVRARALDTYLVTVMDHGMNASTFAARVVASTGADLRSALVAGVCALKGPLHGGAPGPVLDMLDAIAAHGDARAWIDGELAAHRRLMGFGHRIYRVRDPRAFVLERAVAALAGGSRVALARVVERVATDALAQRHPDRPLAANVEFFTAVLLDAIGVPRTSFSTLFATGRVVGWCAHVREQRQHGRLIRPGSRYVGRVIGHASEGLPREGAVLR